MDNTTTIDGQSTPRTEEYDIRIRSQMDALERSLADEIYPKLQDFREALFVQLRSRMDVNKAVEDLYLLPLNDFDYDLSLSISIF